MHAAAQRKGISQPALTKSLKLLEEEAGVELFLRTSKGLEPTEAGDRLYGYAGAIEQERRLATMDMQSSQLEGDTQLRLGVGPAVAVSVLPPALVSFHRTFPNVRLTVENAITERLVDNLVRGDLDVIITSRPSILLPERFASVPLFRNNMVVLCREGHPLRTAQNVTLAQLAHYGRVGFLSETVSVIQTTSLSVMLDLVATTDHFALVNETILPRARRLGLLPLEVVDPLPHLEIDLMCKRTFVASRPIAAICEELRRVDAQLARLARRRRAGSAF
jgi:DNA-binding transcriptional LysR family regulator